MEPVRELFDIFYMDAMAIVAIVLGVFVFLANMRYAFDGLPQALRKYLGVKGVIAMFVSVVYALSFTSIFDPAPPPVLVRAIIILQLLLMGADVLLREADAHAAMLVLKARRKDKSLAEALEADGVIRLRWASKIEKELLETRANVAAPQNNAEVSKDA